MIIICKTHSGMCNRLIPFITSLRLSRVLNAKFYLNWNDDCRDIDYPYKGEKTKYIDMFEKIDDINYINDEETKNLLKINKKIMVLNIYQKITCNVEKLKKYSLIYFNSLCHPIYLKEDNIDFKNYSSIDWVKSDYGKSLNEYFDMLKPSREVIGKIRKVSSIFPKDVIGLHLRHWPGGWLKQNKHLVENSFIRVTEFIFSKIKENSDVKFFISTTDFNKIKKLEELYGEHIIYYKDRFGECEDDMYYLEDQTKSTCNRYKNMNGVVDLYLLSKCDEIVIDTSSSFSLAALLMNKDTKINLLNHKNY